jgi:hypothetical protein
MKKGRWNQMNLDALVKRGRLPWSPTPTARDLDVWYEYEHPRIGTFSSNGRTVLFAAVGGFETRISVWAYTCLESQEADEFSAIDFDSVDDLRELVHETFAGRRVVLALADDLLIQSWAPAETQGELFELATIFLEHVLAETRSRQNAGTQFRAKLAQVDVATHELVDAL